MADPRPISYDPATGIAEIEDEAGVVRRVHRSGLTGSLSGLGMQVDSMAAPQQGMGGGITAGQDPDMAALRGFASQRPREPSDPSFAAAANAANRAPGAARPLSAPAGMLDPVTPEIQYESASESLLKRSQQPAESSPAASPEASNPNDFHFSSARASDPTTTNPYLTGQQPRYAQLPTSTRTQTSRQETERAPLTGEAAALAQRADDANMQQQNAAISLSANQQRAHEQQAQAAVKSADLMERAAAQKQQSLNTREAERQRLMGQANELIEASRTEIDPHRMLNGGNRILAALSVAFGAASAAVTGGQNVGLELINNAIARDIEAQRANNLSKAEAAKGKLSAVQLASQVSDDELTQRDIATATLLGSVEQIAKARIAELAAEDVPDHLTELVAQLEAQGVELRAKIAQSLGNQAVVNTTTKQVGGGIVDMAQRHARAQGGEVYTPELAGKMVPRAGGYHPDDVVRRELTSIGQQYGTMQDAIGNIRREIADASSAVPGSESRKKLEQSVRLLQRMVGGDALLKLGVPSANDGEVQAAVAGDIPSVIDRARGNGAVVFETLRNILTEAEQGQYRDRGVIPLQDLPPMWSQRAVVNPQTVTGQSRSGRASTDFQGGY